MDKSAALAVMTAGDFAEIIKSLAWPVVTVGFIVAFYRLYAL
jgi:hypothetical protein